MLVGLLALVSRTAALTVLTHRWTLLLLQVVLLAFAALWAVLLVDAWRLGHPDRLPRRDRRALLVALLALLLVLPGGAAYAGMNVGAARAAMTSVFTSGEAAGAVDGRYNILLLGGDSGVGPGRAAPRQPPARQRRRRDRPGGALRLLPRDREHQVPPGVGHGRPDAGGLDLR